MEWTIRKAREDAGKMQKRSEIFVEKKDSETANMTSHFKKLKRVWHDVSYWGVNSQVYGPLQIKESGDLSAGQKKIT